MARRPPPVEVPMSRCRYPIHAPPRQQRIHLQEKGFLSSLPPPSIIRSSAGGLTRLQTARLSFIFNVIGPLINPARPEATWLSVSILLRLPYHGTDPHSPGVGEWVVVWPRHPMKRGPTEIWSFDTSVSTAIAYFVVSPYQDFGLRPLESLEEREGETRGEFPAFWIF
jgi:hypothetical protein